MVRRRKINLRSQDVFQFPIAMKLGPIVRRDGFDPVAVSPQQFNRPVQRQFARWRVGSVDAETNLVFVPPPSPPHALPRPWIMSISQSPIRPRLATTAGLCPMSFLPASRPRLSPQPYRFRRRFLARAGFATGFHAPFIRQINGKSSRGSSGLPSCLLRPTICSGLNLWRIRVAMGTNSAGP